MNKIIFLSAVTAIVFSGCGDTLSSSKKPAEQVAMEQEVEKIQEIYKKGKSSDNSIIKNEAEDKIELWKKKLYQEKPIIKGFRCTLTKIWAGNHFTCNEGSFTYNIRLEVDETSRLSKLSNGDKINFDGRVKYEGSLTSSGAIRNPEIVLEQGKLL